METQVTDWIYWRHAWTGQCQRTIGMVNWGTSMFEQITEDEYEDWVWERRAVWTWDKKTAYEELGLELL